MNLRFLSLLLVSALSGGAETSGFAGGEAVWHLSAALDRTADFSSLATIRKRTPWTNGVDGDGFFAFFSTGMPCTNIWRNSGRSYISGLYATATNEADSSSRVLSVLGTGTAGMMLLLPIRLDVRQSIARLTLSFRAHQVAFKAKTKATTLSCAWCAMRELSEMTAAETAWRPLAAGDFAAPFLGGTFPERFADASEERSLELPGSALQGAQYVCFRWCVPKGTNSAMMGLSEVRLSVQLHPVGTRIFLW